jgi:hypothetical protein
MRLRVPCFFSGGHPSRCSPRPRGSELPCRSMGRFPISDLRWILSHTSRFSRNSLIERTPSGCACSRAEIRLRQNLTSGGLAGRLWNHPIQSREPLRRRRHCARQPLGESLHCRGGLEPRR